MGAEKKKIISTIMIPLGVLIGGCIRMTAKWGVYMSVSFVPHLGVYKNRKLGNKESEKFHNPTIFCRNRTVNG